MRGICAGVRCTPRPALFGRELVQFRGGLDAARGLKFIQEIAGRKRRGPLGQPADEPASSDVAVLEQQNRFEIGVFRDRGIEHFEGGALAAPA